MAEPKPCRRQQELIAAVQKHLLRLAALARTESEVISGESENAWMAVDREIENELGEKERAMGALKQHRAEHGC